MTPTVFHHVVVPLDGSALSEAALDPARRLLGEAQATLYLLRVLAPTENESPEARDARIESAQAHLREVERRLQPCQHDVELHVRHGDPAEAILAFSADVSADLLAMSSHGRCGLERLVRGSVAERVMRNSPLPVLQVTPCAPVGWERGFERVLVPLDGSARSESILPLAKAVARQFGSELLLFHVRGPWEVESVAPYGPRAEALLEELRAEGFKASYTQVEGAPAAEILKAAEDTPCALLAMSTRGATGPQRWIFGSVAEDVLRHARSLALVQRA